MGLETDYIREQLNNIKLNLNKDYLKMSPVVISLLIIKNCLFVLFFKLVPCMDDFFIAVAFTQ